MSHPPPSHPIRKVLLVEDSLRMQEILIWSVQTAPGLELVAMADTAAEALGEFDRCRPEVVILDLALREGSGLDVLREIKQRAASCRVLVFTTHDTEPFRTRCMAAGADYFFSKNKQHRELIQVLQQLGAQASALTLVAAPAQTLQPGVNHV
jgi:DNA-binding NarL/FixJ family response regulator